MKQSMITVSSLTRTYGDMTAVDTISFDVEQGEIFAFLGPNGAGKSTTIKMLTTLLAPTSGTIRVNGFDPREQQSEVRKSFGIVFQDPSLDDDLTAYENMALHGAMYHIPTSLIPARIATLLNLVDLEERKNDLVKTFSGGMKRRLEIARGLMHQPKILFLDEPTLGLDPQTRNSMWKYIEDINKKDGMTVFFTTHYMEEAQRVAKRIAIIDHGKIIAEGTTEVLLRKTSTSTLEEAFLKLTGTKIREEEVTGADRMRMMRRVWRGRR